MPPLGRKAYNIPPGSNQMGVSRDSACPLPQPSRMSLQKAEPLWLREELPGARGNHALAIFSSRSGEGGGFTIWGRFPYLLLETHLSSEKGGCAGRRGQLWLSCSQWRQPSPQMYTNTLCGMRLLIWAWKYMGTPQRKGATDEGFAPCHLSSILQ